MLLLVQEQDIPRLKELMQAEWMKLASRENP